MRRSIASSLIAADFDLTRMFTSHWIVADMDGTLTPTPSKAHGHYLPLSQSPCLTPVQTFLSGGGSVCVVSTAGRRMWTQVYEVLKPSLFPPSSSASQPGTLYICGFSGAALFVSDPSTQSMREILEYRLHGGPDGTSTILPPDQMPRLEALMRGALLKSLHRVKDDPAYLAKLSRKYHEPLSKLIHEVYHVRGETLDSTPLLHMDCLKQHGLYLTATNDALLDVQVIPTPDGKVPQHPEQTVAAQITVLAIPMAHASEIFDHDTQQQLAEMGLTAKMQPNSVVVTRSGLDKATCVRYLTSSCGMDLRKAIALGDVPASIDRPLTLFPPMQFVSVSPDRSQDPPGVLHVGGEEEGTAVFLELLLNEANNGITAPSSNEVTTTSNTNSSLFCESVLLRCSTAAAQTIFNRRNSNSDDVATTSDPAPSASSL